MNKLFPPFFTRLYSSIFLAIFLSMFVSFFIIDKWQGYDAVADFVTDTSFIKKVLEAQRIEQKLTEKQFYQTVNSNLYPFNISWRALSSPMAICQNCRHLSTNNHIKIYERDTGELISFHPLSTGDSGIIIEDKIESSDTQPFAIAQDAEEPEKAADIEEFAIVIILIVIVLVIGFVLLLQLRKLQKEINHLTDVSKKIAHGQLNVRSHYKFSEPLISLAKCFDKMADALENRVNESQIFAQAVPHELRTPLSRIQMATGILRKQNLPETQVALVDNIDQYIEDIDQLCSQIIQFSKINISTSQEATELLELNAFIQDRITQLNLDQQISITVKPSPAIELMSLKTNLRLMFDNLLKNAVSHANSTVKIQFNQQSDLLEFIIEDDGKGIAKEHYEKIFIPYARLDSSRSRETGGLGMGLAITKSAVNQLNGQIEICSSSLGGAKFVVKLPINKASINT